MRAAPCLFYPAAKELGFRIEEVLTDARKQARLLAHIAAAFPGEAVIRMTELWCEAAACGMPVSFPDGDFPRLGPALLREPEKLETFSPPQPRNKITAPLIEAVALAAPDKPLIVGVTGPYTLAAVLRGSEDFMMDCMMDEETAAAFLDRLTEFLISYILQYKAAGAAGVMIAEPSTAMISPEMAENLSNRCLRRIIEAVQDPQFCVIYHNCGAVNHLLPVISRLPARGFHFGSQVDLRQAAALLPEDRLLLGNLEPQLFIGKHRDALEQAKNQLLFLEERKNFILSTGCDLSPAADPDMVRQIFA